MSMLFYQQHTSLLEGDGENCKHKQIAGALSREENEDLRSPARGMISIPALGAHPVRHTTALGLSNLLTALGLRRRRSTSAVGPPVGAAVFVVAAAVLQQLYHLNCDLARVKKADVTRHRAK